jgi:hypothetical protein
VAVQQLPVFLLEALYPVVFPLFADVMLHLGLLRLAQGERAIAILPAEAAAARNILPYPAGRPALDLFERSLTATVGGMATNIWIWSSTPPTSSGISWFWRAMPPK